jgi:DNA/RNA-binding domain of Phe-tRNA-synthetase-like protein
MISFSPEVLSISPFLDIGYAVLANISVARENPYLEELKRKTMVEIQSRYSLSELKRVTSIKAFRDMYWSFKMDPTKIRPSAEALARRVLTGEMLPSIDTVVDAINVVSLKHLLPVSCFNMGALRGSITVRRAIDREYLHTIQGVNKGIEKGNLVLSDEEGIVCLGYASMDAYETRIIPETEEIAILVYKAPGIKNQDILDCLTDACDLLSTVAQGTIKREGSLVKGVEER